MQPNFSDSYHDYLDLMDPRMDSVTVFDTGPTFGVYEDDFDDYLNQLSEYMLYQTIKNPHN